MLSRLVRVIHGVTDLAAILAGLIVLTLIGAMVYEVVMRYFFNAPTLWAFELSYMSMGTGFALTIAYALKERAHVRMDLIYAQLPARAQAMVDLAGFGLLILPLSLWLTWRLGWYALDAYHSGEISGKSAWNPQIWPFRVMLVIGFTVLSLQLVAEIVVAARSLLTGRADEGRVVEVVS